MSDVVLNPMPRIGDVAPDFQAVTTQGTIEFSEWQGGHWVLMFSHPADFTPVCSTELSEFAKRSEEFEQRHTRTLAARELRQLGGHLFVGKLETSERRTDVTVLEIRT